MNQLPPSSCPRVSPTSPTSDALLTKGQRPVSATCPVLVHTQETTVSREDKAAVRGTHYMHLHLSELTKDGERPCSPLGSHLLGKIRQLRPSPSTYRGDTEVSGEGIHSLLFLLFLKATDKSSCYIHPPVLQDTATFRAHMDEMESKLSSDRTQRTWIMTLTSLLFSHLLICLFLKCPKPIPSLGLGLTGPTPRTHLPQSPPSKPSSSTISQPQRK